jgi:hypothetical protein
MSSSTLATNEFPMPANLRPSSGPMPASQPASQPAGSPAPRPADLATAFRSFAGHETFTLDQDLKPALQDMHASMREKTWQQFLQEVVNDAIRNWLGR